MQNGAYIHIAPDKPRLDESQPDSLLVKNDVQTPPSMADYAGWHLGMYIDIGRMDSAGGYLHRMQIGEGLEGGWSGMAR